MMLEDFYIFTILEDAKQFNDDIFKITDESIEDVLDYDDVCDGLVHINFTNDLCQRLYYIGV